MREECTIDSCTDFAKSEVDLDHEAAFAAKAASLICLLASMPHVQQTHQQPGKRLTQCTDCYTDREDSAICFDVLIVMCRAYARDCVSHTY